MVVFKFLCLLINPLGVEKGFQASKSKSAIQIFKNVQQTQQSKGTGKLSLLNCKRLPDPFLPSTLHRRLIGCNNIEIYLVNAIWLLSFDLVLLQYWNLSLFRPALKFKGLYTNWMAHSPCHFSVSPHSNPIRLFKSGLLQCDKSSNYQISTWF